MARNRTVTNLITDVRRRSDTVGATARYADAEIVDYLNQSYTWLHGLLAEQLGYFESTQTITSIASTATYALPSDFWKAIGVDYKLDAERWIPLERLQHQERNDFNVTGSRALAYRIVGSNTTLYPAPTAVQTYRLTYVPMPYTLVSGTPSTNEINTVDGIAGWEEILVLHAAIKVMRREESDTRALERDLDREIARLEAERAQRDLTPGHIVNEEHVGGTLSFDPASFYDYRRPRRRWR